MNEVRGTSWAGPLLALVFFAAVSLFMVGPQVFPPTLPSSFAYAQSDSFIFFWNFWWTKKALIEGLNPFYTDYLFYPRGTDLSFHSYPLSYSLLSLPFQWWIPGPEGLAVAFNTIVLLSFVLSGFGAYRLALYVTGSRAGALLAGLVFAFLPFRFLNMSRLHVLATELLPFYALALLRFADGPSRRRALVVGGLLALSFYTSLEYALYLGIFSVFFVGYRLATRALRLPALGHLAVGAALFLILASPLLLAQVRARAAGRADTEYPIRSLNRWAPALVSFVTPTRYHPLYGHWLEFAGDYGGESRYHLPGMRSETYIGVTALLLALVGTVEAWRKRSLFWVLSALLFLLLTLGPYLRLTGKWQTDLPLPYHLVYWVLPPIRASRDCTRLLPLFMMAMVVLSSFGLGRVLRSVTGRIQGALLAAVFMGLALFEFLVPTPTKMSIQVDPFYYRIAADPGDFAVLDLSFEKNAILAQTVHGRKITAGALIVPRSASVRSKLQVERDVLDPVPVLTLPPDERAARLSWDGAEIHQHRIRYLVYPGGSRGPRLRLAKLLGAETVASPPLVFCTFESVR